jgi:hypothetical protein
LNSSYLNYCWVIIFSRWKNLILVEKSLWSRPCIIFLKIYVFIISPKLEIEIWKKPFNFFITFTITILWWVANIKVNINSCISIIKTIIIQFECWLILKVWTDYTKSIPRIKHLNIIFIVSKVFLSAPFCWHSLSWRVKALREVEFLVFPININILK